MHSGSPRTLSFSGYVLDLQRCALMHGDQEIQLRPKSFDVLRYLAEHAGRLVSKEELIKASWPDTFVTDDSLVQCIKDIREALADGDHQIVKTVPRRGYLFAAELSNGDTMVVATAARARRAMARASARRVPRIWPVRHEAAPRDHRERHCRTGYPAASRPLGDFHGGP
jgi:DNA-binding winged helix-turn-helix (wHTH) protein